MTVTTRNVRSRSEHVHMARPKVVTHQGRAAKVELCAAHTDDETLRRWIGPDYHGVSYGAHVGACAECVRAKSESE